VISQKKQRGEVPNYFVLANNERDEGKGLGHPGIRLFLKRKREKRGFNVSIFKPMFGKRYVRLGEKTACVTIWKQKRFTTGERKIQHGKTDINLRMTKPLITKGLAVKEESLC